MGDMAQIIATAKTKQITESTTKWTNKYEWMNEWNTIVTINEHYGKSAVSVQW